MSFGGLFDGGSGGTRVVADIPYGSSAMPAGAISQSRLVSPSLSKPSLSRLGNGLLVDLGCGLLGRKQTNVEGQGDRSLASIVSGATAAGGGGSGGGGGRDSDALGSNREDENESRSGSDNLEGSSDDDIDQENPRKKKRYHRHTPQQIQELEA